MNNISWMQWSRDENRHVLYEYDLDTMTMPERANLLVNRLNIYDATYMMSDDHSVWMHGEISRNLIHKIGRTLPREIYVEEWYRMCCRHFSPEYLATDEGRGWLLT